MLMFLGGSVRGRSPPGGGAPPGNGWWFPWFFIGSALEFLRIIASLDRRTRFKKVFVSQVASAPTDPRL